MATITITKEERKRANKEINSLLKRFQGKGIIDLLPVIKLRFPKYILQAAIERLERKKLKIEDKMFLVEFKESLNNNENK